MQTFRYTSVSRILAKRLTSSIQVVAAPEHLRALLAAVTQAPAELRRRFALETYARSVTASTDPFKT